MCLKGNNHTDTITANWTVQTYRFNFDVSERQLWGLCLPGSGSCTNRPLTLQSRFILSISSSNSSWDTELGRTTVSLEIPGEHKHIIHTPWLWSKSQKCTVTKPSWIMSWGHGEIHRELGEINRCVKTIWLHCATADIFLKLYSWWRIQHFKIDYFI